jgi:hypothetical protein
MTGTEPKPLTYSELYADPGRNPFGIEDERKEVCYSGMYQVWRATTATLTEPTSHQNVLADFSRPIGCICIYVADDKSPTGILKFLNRVKSFPGTPGRSRDIMVSLCCEGDVSGVDISTFAFDGIQLEVTPNVVVPGSYKRFLQLISEEPTHEDLGPLFPTHANVRTTQTGGGCFPC